MIDDRAGTLLDLLVEINRDITSALDLRTVLQRLAYAAMRHVGGERVSLIVLDESGRPVDAVIILGTTLHEHTTKQLRDTMERGLAGWAIRNRKAVLVPDTSQDERWVRRPDDAKDQSGAKSAVCVPLLANEKLAGVFTVVHSVPNAFGPEHLELAKLVADRASIALLNARLYSESLRQARIMTALADSAAAFGSTLEVNEVLQKVLNQTLQALQVETAGIALLEGPEQSIVFCAAAGKHAGAVLKHRITGGKGLAGQVVREAKGIVLPKAAEDPRFTEADRFTGLEVRGVAAAPVQAQGKVMGVLEALNPVGRGFDPDALTVMMGMGGLAGSTIHNAQIFEQLQLAHRRYRELFEESIDPIFVTDLKGRITEVNRRATELTGYAAQNLKLMNMDALHQINWKAVGVNFQALREADRSPYEATLEAAEGRRIPVEVHALRLDGSGDEAVLWTMRDLTERKELDRLRQELTSMIFHDLRSPLGNLSSSLDLLGEAVANDANAKSMLDIALHSADRMHRLVNSLLDINRLEAGQPLNLEKAAPEAVLRRAVKDVELSAAARTQIITTRIGPAVPSILMDADMIRRVLTNLLENAIKFSPDGSEVEVGVQPEGRWVQFWVQDQGPGIPAEDQARIFDKFTQLKSAKEQQPGLGMGLAFCRLAVLAHGGTVSVSSADGKGSRFAVRLPAKLKQD